MTVAVDAVARRGFGATRMPCRRGAAEDAWESLPTLEKYNRRSVVGEMVLPALVALPERPTVGATPQFSDEEYDTIGGLVMQQFGRLPRRGEAVTMDGIEFKVLRADRRRIDQLRVTTPGPLAAPAGEAQGD